MPYTTWGGGRKGIRNFSVKEEGGGGGLEEHLLQKQTVAVVVYAGANDEPTRDVTIFHCMITLPFAYSSM